MVLQPVLGWFHHKYYMKHKARGPISYGHLWYGRTLMLGGLINVGLGLQLASGSTMLMTMYAIVAAVMGALYISVKLFKFMIKRNEAQAEEIGIQKITSNMSDPRWEGNSVNSIEMRRYNISRPQQV